MPGAVNKRKSKKPNGSQSHGTGGELLFKDAEQMYALVAKPMGAKRFRVSCDDGVERTGKCRGKMRRSEWVAVSAYVLVCTRDFADDKVDIIHVYSDAHARLLRKYGEFDGFQAPAAAEHDRAAAADDGDDDDLIEFENEDDFIDVI